jgi:hypothetical protein
MTGVLDSLVRPPSATARTWSACRIGASHHGVRQRWSRSRVIPASAFGTRRDVASIATSRPVSGWT